MSHDSPDVIRLFSHYLILIGFAYDSVRRRTEKHEYWVLELTERVLFCQ
jgi:hypothetical protein